MFTLFELFYLVMYLTTLFGFFSYSLSHLQSLENGRKDLSEIDRYLSVLDEYLYFDIIDNIDNIYDLNKNMEILMVYVDDSEISKFQLLLLYDMFPNSEKIAICLSDDDLNIMRLCDELNYKYYNKSDEYLNSDVKDKKEFMIRYCKLCNIKYCFMNINNNELMSVIFDSFFNNDYRKNIDNIDKSEEECIFVYNLFSNEKIYLSYVNLWDHCFDKFRK